MATTISPEVADILRRATIEGAVLRLPEGQLARPLYVALDNVIKMLGGKWDRRKGGHVFPFDPTDRLAEALGTGSVTSRQQTLQHFDTPPLLAARLVGLLQITTSDICLEPSAGRGRIVEAMAGYEPLAIHAVEIDADNAIALGRMGQVDRLSVRDFLGMQSGVGPWFDAIGMNPPFRGNQDIRHVRHAWEFLNPGGLLAAIVSEHGFIGQERECSEWRAWLDEIGATVEIILAGTFKESGTTIQTRLISARRGD